MRHVTYVITTALLAAACSGDAFEPQQRLAAPDGGMDAPSLSDAAGAGGSGGILLDTGVPDADATGGSGSVATGGATGGVGTGGSAVDAGPDASGGTGAVSGAGGACGEPTCRANYCPQDCPTGTPCCTDPCGVCGCWSAGTCEPR